MATLNLKDHFVFLNISKDERYGYQMPDVYTDIVKISEYDESDGFVRADFLMKDGSIEEDFLYFGEAVNELNKSWKDVRKRVGAVVLQSNTGKK